MTKQLETTNNDRLEHMTDSKIETEETQLNYYKH